MVANAALATNFSLAEAPSPSHGTAARGAHARTGRDAPAIRVIACPGGAGHLPQHARALPAAAMRTGHMSRAFFTPRPSASPTRLS